MLLLIIALPAFAQQGNHSVTAENFENIVQELELDKTHKVIAVRKSKKEDTNVPEDQRKRQQGSAGKNITELLAFTAIIFLVIIILYIVFSKVKVAKREEAEEPDEVIAQEQDILDPDAVYLQAIRAGDYRLAIRMQYLKVLAYLQKVNLIAWEPEKTNRDYLEELRDRQQYSFFNKLSSIYEWVWYGNTQLTEQDFRQFDYLFQQFLKSDDE
ncbi:MAG: DUF4129 domain-containing protein [Saprospiraceae bacterium]|nr:DUF4129 domain-containing protein [Saprospiraceae bacterium]